MYTDCVYVRCCEVCRQAPGRIPWPRCAGCRGRPAAAAPPASETRSLSSAPSAGPAGACSSPCTPACVKAPQSVSPRPLYAVRALGLKPHSPLPLDLHGQPFHVRVFEVEARWCWLVGEVRCFGRSRGSGGRSVSCYELEDGRKKTHVGQVVGSQNLLSTTV